MIDVTQAAGTDRTLAVLAQYRMATTERMHRVIAPEEHIEQTRGQVPVARDRAGPRPGVAGYCNAPAATTACSLLGGPDRPFHIKLHSGPHRALLSRVLGDRSLYVSDKVAPCLPRGLVSGRIALVA